MADLSLFPKDKVRGIFRGFSEGGLEFHAEIVLPYRSEFQSTPMHGQFLLIQLESENEAVLGRVTSLHSDGRLASGSGEDFGLRALVDDREVPDDLREQYLKYRVDIRVLGVVRRSGNEIHFAASHRRLPHVGSRVAFLSAPVLREIAGHNVTGADLGFFALGEFIYAKGDPRLDVKPWMQPVEPIVVTKFDIRQLVARRSFIFARAGFGKSNLTKLLFSNLYKTDSPTVEKRGGRRVPVGTIIFDPDGEYFWPDDKNRPGLCDVPELQNQVVVFTRRQGPSQFYQSFVASSIKLDIRRLKPGDVVAIALSPEKQDQQNVTKLKALRQDAWESLVNEIARHGNLTDLAVVREILHLDERSDFEALAARSNMTTIVNMLHDASSQMMDMLLAALRDGKLCVVDVSQLRGGPALVLSGLILNKIFETNQEEFTKATPQTIPTIAVIEEAQSVLGSGRSGGEGPYVAWVKEGRKYDLGAVMITQQPGSISPEILSQGDNWFIFHLLSSGDLQTVRKANAHFSDDLLSALLNEPIEGHGVFWSSSGGRPYPVPIRALLFESAVKRADPDYKRGAADTYASKLREKYHKLVRDAVATKSPAETEELWAPVSEESPLAGDTGADVPPSADQPIDAIAAYRANALKAVSEDSALREKLESEKGIPWMGVQTAIIEKLPEAIADRNTMAYHLVPKVLDAMFGEGKWESVKLPKRNSPSQTTTWLRKSK